MFNYWVNFSMLAAEAQQVVWLRSIKFVSGGDKAGHEAQRMLMEKIDAAQGAALTLMTGGSAEKVLFGYRKKVRSNIRRLSK
jgi:hypothetical protein